MMQQSCCTLIEEQAGQSSFRTSNKTVTPLYPEKVFARLDALARRRWPCRDILDGSVSAVDGKIDHFEEAKQISPLKLTRSRCREQFSLPSIAVSARDGTQEHIAFNSINSLSFHCIFNQASGNGFN